MNKVVATLHREGSIAQPIFSFNLQDVESAEFVLGGLDPQIVKKPDEMTWQPVRNDAQYGLWWTLDAQVKSGTYIIILRSSTNLRFCVFFINIRAFLVHYSNIFLFPT